MTKAKKELSLRQQMRKQAELDLDALLDNVREAVSGVAPGYLGSVDLLKLLSSSQTKTVRERVITKMANQAEAELVKLWNNQQKLDLGEDNAAPSDG